MGNQWNYFSEKEVEGLDPFLVAKADVGRHESGIPWIITSGRRSTDSNEQAHGVVDSAHLTGKAMDLRVRTSSELGALLRGIYKAEFKRVVLGIRIDPQGNLIYHNVHVDIDETKPQNLCAIKIYPST